MIEYAERFAKKQFTAETMKDAYMKAIKWYATNVISKDELHNVQVKIVKDTKGQYPTVTLHLYVALEEKEISERHCKVCKQMHSAFFINESYNCNQCSYNGYKERLKQALRLSKEYCREKIK